MARGLLQRYIWLVDTIARYGRISRHELDRLWMRSQFSSGAPMPRRTFYNYRLAVEELFNIEIKCDQSTFEYYISDHGDAHNEGVTRWLMNTAMTNEVLANSRAVASRIFLEEVPSARDFLAPVIDALRENKPLHFDYHPYSRSLPSRGVVVEPYFLKIYRQRWYVTGRHVDSDKIKTYALDRISNLTLGAEPFEPDPAFDAEDYFRYSFGIIFNMGEVKRVVIKAERKQAQYFRALPLHHTQEEAIHDDFSIFTYRLRISPDFVGELLSYGPRIQVLEPPELKQMLVNELKKALEQYQG